MAIVLKSKSSMIDTLVEECDWTNKLLRALEKTPNNLRNLFVFYKELANEKFDLSFVDCRCDNPLEATLNDIYLGNINGIWTNNIPTFEELKEKDPDTYQTVVKQFRNQLLRSLKQHKSCILDSGVSRERLVANIIDASNKFFYNHKSEFNNEELHVVKCSVMDGMINRDSIVHLDLRLQNGYGVYTSGVVIDGGWDFYLPEEFYRSTDLKPKDLETRRFANLDTIANSQEEICSVFKKNLSHMVDYVKVNTVSLLSDNSKRSEVKERYLHVMERRKSKGLQF